MAIYVTSYEDKMKSLNMRRTWGSEALVRAPCWPPHCVCYQIASPSLCHHPGLPPSELVRYFHKRIQYLISHHSRGDSPHQAYSVFPSRKESRFKLSRRWSSVFQAECTQAWALSPKETCFTHPDSSSYTKRPITEHIPGSLHHLTLELCVSTCVPSRGRPPSPGIPTDSTPLHTCTRTSHKR